ncbi:MAG: class I SAM-dependent methyltransferase [Candidatus Delongbacteria bacterium]
MKDELIDQMERVQREHFWFRARAEILLALLQPLLRPGLRVLDAGCGTGLLLSRLTGGLRLAGLDQSPRALEHAAARLPGAELRAGSLPGPLPFQPASQDLILLTDVLEHIEDDAGSLLALRDLLAPGGRLLLTVPALPTLWTRHDEEHGHFRRYTRPQLALRLAAAGFELEKLSYYNCLLLPLVLAVRELKRLLGRDGDDMETPARPLNSLLYQVFALERHWLPRANFPLGVSLVAVARRPSSAPAGASAAPQARNSAL